MGVIYKNGIPYGGGTPVLPNGQSVEAEIQSINTRLDDIESQSPSNIEYVTAADAESWFS